MNQTTEFDIATPFGTLAGLAWGDAHLPPLLALHGWLDNAASFARLAPRLAAQHRVLALDLPGHGHSAHLPPNLHRYHAMDQVEIVLDAADALGLARFDLLGHSLGAGIASLIAAAAPSRIGRLVLIDGLGNLADDGTSTLARWRDTYARGRTRQRAARVFPSIEAAVAARVAAGGLDADEARPIVARNLRAADGGYSWCSDARLRLDTPIRTHETQVRSILTAITSATLLLLAEPATPYLPSAMMNARAACVPHLQQEHIAGPHHLHIRHPTTIAERVLAFLDPSAASRGDRTQPIAHA